MALANSMDLAIINDPDLDVTGSQTKLLFTKVKYTRIIIFSILIVMLNYLHENNIDLPHCIIISMLYCIV